MDNEDKNLNDTLTEMVKVELSSNTETIKDELNSTEEIESENNTFDGKIEIKDEELDTNVDEVINNIENKEENYVDDIVTSNNEDSNSDNKNKKGNSLLPIILLAILIVIGICAYFVYDKYIKDDNREKTNGDITPTPSVAVQVTPTPVHDKKEKTFAYNLKNGDAIELSGYNWHVISSNDDVVTLLMDANQLPDMKHCTNDTDDNTDCGIRTRTMCDCTPGTDGCLFETELDCMHTFLQYNWSKSLIRSYLNNTFYNSLENNIQELIIPTKICVDDSESSWNIKYDGFLSSEIDAMKKSCDNYVSDKVRLITFVEFKNLSNTISNNCDDCAFYRNNEIIALNSEKYYEWFLNIGQEYWGMADGVIFATDWHNPDAMLVGNSEYHYVREGYTVKEYGVRPVITLKKFI